MEVQQYCEQLARFNNAQLQIIQRRVKEQINNNITRTVQEEDLAFQERVHLQYSCYKGFVSQNSIQISGVSDWSFDQFRDFYEDHGANWNYQLSLIMLSKQ